VKPLARQTRALSPFRGSAAISILPSIGFPDIYPQLISLNRVRPVFAILLRRTARARAVMLAILYSVFALLWVPRILGSPQVYDAWADFFEKLSLVIAGVVVYASLVPLDSVWAARTARISRLYGVSVISFALERFFYMSWTASFVPSGIPPDNCFGR